MSDPEPDRPTSQGPSRRETLLTCAGLAMWLLAMPVFWLGGLSILIGLVSLFVPGASRETAIQAIVIPLYCMAGYFVLAIVVLFLTSTLPEDQAPPGPATPAAPPIEPVAPTAAPREHGEEPPPISAPSAAHAEEPSPVSAPRAEPPKPLTRKHPERPRTVGEKIDAVLFGMILYAIIGSPIWMVLLLICIVDVVHFSVAEQRAMPGTPLWVSMAFLIFVGIYFAIVFALVRWSRYLKDHPNHRRGSATRT